MLVLFATTTGRDCCGVLGAAAAVPTPAGAVGYMLPESPATAPRLWCADACEWYERFQLGAFVGKGVCTTTVLLAGGEVICCSAGGKGCLALRKCMKNPAQAQLPATVTFACCNASTPTHPAKPHQDLRVPVTPENRHFSGAYVFPWASKLFQTLCSSLISNLRTG